MVASYRYDPFGNSISSIGTLASANVYRFSSKEYHATSGMYYYLYRFYDPTLQRWINSDPSEDLGFHIMRYQYASQYLRKVKAVPDTYRFVQNRPGDSFDPLGLINFVLSCSVDSCSPKDMEETTRYCQLKYGPGSFSTQCIKATPNMPITIGPVTFRLGIPIRIFKCMELNDFPGGLPGVGPGTGAA
jgi:RHS repeat-associated protein